MSSKSELPALSRGELPIMEVIWTEGETTIRHVWETLSAKGDSQTRATVQVQMGRLELKGWLKKKQKGRTYFYRATADENDTKHGIAKEMTQTLFGSSAAKFIRCLSGGGKELTDDEVEDLQALIDERKKSKKKKKS